MPAYKPVQTGSDLINESSAAKADVPPSKADATKEKKTFSLPA